MIDNKLTDNEIIKAMKGCACTPDCKWCPYYDPKKEYEEKCYIRRNRDFNNLMKHKDEQIEALIAGQETLQKYISEKDAEIERLKDKLDTAKREIVETIPLIEEDIKIAKAEVVKEIIERLEAEITISDKYVRRYNDTKDRTYNNSLREALKIVKEMVGEDE